MTVSVLFVCLGNICRSPLAEAALRQECARVGRSMIVDSAGTSDWHAEQAPDERAIAVAAKNGAELSHLRGRQIERSDFRDFDHIIALDNQNMQALNALNVKNTSAQLSLLSDYIEGRAGDDIADPYYGDAAGFEQTWAEVTEAARVLIARL